MADDEVPPEAAVLEADPETAKRRQDETLQELYSSVECEEISPSEAEAAAAGAGLSFINGQRWPVSFSDPYWPLVYAVLWIVWRDAGRTAREWDRFRVFAGHVWRDPVQESQRMTFGLLPVPWTRG